MRQPILLLSILLLISFHSYSQAPEERKFGDIKTADFDFPTSISDSTAGAVILFDKGKISTDHNFETILTHHVRILLLNSNEFDRATIKIPYGVKDYIKKIKGSSYNIINGKVVESEVSKKDIFTEKVSDEVRQERFTIPNVKEGSIIEYSYIVSHGNLSSLATWYFQTSVPVVYSEYVVKMPSFFNYVQLLSGTLPLSDVSFNTENAQRNGYSYQVVEKKFISRNVPAFVSEPFITGKENYISKIKFDLSDYQFPGGHRVNLIPPTYFELSKKLAADEYYKGVYSGNNFFKNELETIFSGLDSDLDKIKAIYYFVQENYSIDTDIMSSSMRKIFNEKKGLRQDINMILTSMLNKAGYESYIVRLSTRSNGPLNEIYKSAKNFNYSICLVRLEGNDYLLDASEDYLPFNTLRPETINGKGLIISEENPGWVDLKYDASSKERAYSTIKILETGGINGVVQLQKSDYSAYYLKKEFDKLDKYIDKFQDDLPVWEITDHQITDHNKHDLKETINFEISESEIMLDDKVYFSPILFNKVSSNPFKLDKRLFPVTLQCPIDNNYTYRIEVPEGFEVEQLPKDLLIALPNEGGKYLYRCQLMNGAIMVNSTLSINKDFFTVEEYFYLKEFYAQIVEKQAEQIVIAKRG